MAIAGRIDPAAPAGERARRRSLRLDTTGELGGELGGAAANVTVHNISTTGLLIETALPLPVGETLSVTLPEAGAVAAVVIWSSGVLHGCRFTEPVGPAVLSAAQLRSAVSPAGAAVRKASGSPLPGATMAQRIAAARKARGFSLAQVADALGVSRPTVWAWEQGRARPADRRLAALAEVLGVTAAALAIPGRDERLAVVVEEARQRVAQAAAVPTEQVRILIEL